MSEYSNTNFSNYKYRTRPNLSCVVCSAAAFGMNFNASSYLIIQFFVGLFSYIYLFILVTCQSCKAFFRRNALKPSVRIGMYQSGI
jgi:tellurite resistance protein TehA-like permease